MPWKSRSFAYMSPNVRVTDSLPGYTRNGPTINSYYVSFDLSSQSLSIFVI